MGEPVTIICWLFSSTPPSQKVSRHYQTTKHSASTGEESSSFPQRSLEPRHQDHRHHRHQDYQHGRQSPTPLIWHPHTIPDHDPKHPAHGRGPNPIQQNTTAATPGRQWRLRWYSIPCPSACARGSWRPLPVWPTFTALFPPPTRHLHRTSASPCLPIARRSQLIFGFPLVSLSRSSCEVNPRRQLTWQPVSPSPLRLCPSCSHGT